MRLDARGWGSSQPKLDIGVKNDTFQIWKDRAMMFLTRERPDVRRLLTWAETCTNKETLHAGLAAQAAQLGITDLANIEYALHDGIKMTIMDTLLGRARICDEHGCEFWRMLCAEWSGAAPQLRMAKATRFQQPPTCKSMQELWTKLPAWERLGEEVATSGFVVPPWIQSVALDSLLPTQLADALRSRASHGDELAEFPARLAWVKVQREHARGVAQASTYSGHGKDASGDVNMYSVDAPDEANDPVEAMTWALAEASHAGQWELAETLTCSISALKGNKGGFRKGFGKGKSGGKGAASPAAAAKGGGTGAEFQGLCNHCGNWGHRLAECRKLSQELGKKGGSKGKAGGKGGPKGGKGPLVDPLLEVTADDDWAGELGADAAAAELDEWCFDSAICSLAANHCDRNGAGWAGTGDRAVLAAAGDSDASEVGPRSRLHVRPVRRRGRGEVGLYEASGPEARVGAHPPRGAVLGHRLASLHHVQQTSGEPQCQEDGQSGVGEAPEDS